jgi:hypothetical protein
MTLENRLFGLGRKTIIPIILAGSLALMGCNSPRHQNPVQNQEPGTTVVENFGEGLSGNVEYTVCGLDSNSYVKYIDTWENGAGFKRHQNTTAVNPYCDIFEVPITGGTNTLEAQAVDSQNLADPTPAVNEFYSPTEEEARAVIEGILGDNGYTVDCDIPIDPNTYCMDRPVSTGEGFIENVDFKLKRSNETIAIVEYIGENDDPIKELEEKQILDDTPVPNLYLRRLPLDEIEKRFNGFADNYL